MVGDSSGKALPVVLRSACRLWDSPVVLVGVWTAVAITSTAVLMQHQRMAEASSGMCAGSAASTESNRFSSASLVASAFGAKRKPLPDGIFFSRVWDRLSREATSSKERAASLITLQHIAENVFAHPQEQKFARIYKKNPAYMKALGHLPAAPDAMRALGFEDFTLPEAWHFGGSQADLWLLEGCIEELRRLRAETPH